MIEHYAAEGWAVTDDSLFMIEGWGLFEAEGFYRIERIDELNLFKDDNAAIAFVKKKADEGSKLHLEALSLHGMKVPLPELPTRTYADISTAHVTADDVEYLSSLVDIPTLGPLSVYETAEYGWLVYTGPQAGIADDKIISPEFRALLEQANAQGCTFLRLDRDGPIVDRIPHFNW